MSSERIPVVDRPANVPIATRAGQPISTATFCAEVQAVADTLPAATHILNLVEDRYAFSVAFAAVVAAGKCNVLPASPKPAVQAEIAAHFDAAAVLHDGIEVALGLAQAALVLPAVTASTAPRVACYRCRSRRRDCIHFRLHRQRQTHRQDLAYVPWRGGGIRR
ncbi:MAG: hypothetical protein AAGF46_11695, partial [Pseudomonadota bacterium]